MKPILSCSSTFVCFSIINNNSVTSRDVIIPQNDAKWMLIPVKCHNSQFPIQYQGKKTKQQCLNMLLMQLNMHWNSKVYFILLWKHLHQTTVCIQVSCKKTTFYKITFEAYNLQHIFCDLHVEASQLPLTLSTSPAINSMTTPYLYKLYFFWSS